MKQRGFLYLLAAICLSWSASSFAAPSERVASPNGALKMTVQTVEGKLSYDLQFRGKPVVERSPMGIIVDGVNLGENAQMGAVERSRFNETYAWRGVHSTAINKYAGARIAMRSKTGQAFTVEVRMFNDGVAFRYIVPGTTETRVPDEATGFRLPAGSTVWYHGFRGHYEGVHEKKAIADVKAEEWAAPPLTFQLPGGAYGSITEGALMNYAGMGLQADGKNGFNARLGHAIPASYPYTLRYGQAEADRLAKPAAITGTIQTPWRVVMVGADLNTLVNCDIPANVSPSADPKYFPQGIHTEWTKSGRAVWKYLDGGGQNNLEVTKDFSRLAGQLGFEYNVVEGYWHRWTDAEIRDLVDYSNQQHVRVLFWEFSKNLRDTETRRKLFSRLHSLGVGGMKIDFFDHEAKEVIDLYQACMQDAAENQLVLVLHGANKPTGEARAWPNELAKEGIYGLEHSNVKAWAPITTTLPFTRMLAGPADFTPMAFGDKRKETSWPHQIATAAIINSPMLIYAAHPQSILDNPAAELIKTIPAGFDETIVLPVSRIGEIAAYARRSGDRWFLAILNGPEAKQVKIDLSFLDKGDYQTFLVRDQMDNPAAEKIEKGIATRKTSLVIDLRAGGGFVGSFTKK